MKKYFFEHAPIVLLNLYASAMAVVLLAAQAYHVLPVLVSALILDVVYLLLESKFKSREMRS